MIKSLLTSCVIMATCVAGLAADKADKATEGRFDVLLKKIQADPGGSKEPEVQEMLKLAKSLGRPHAASLVVRGYLSHHFQPSPGLMRATAEAAYLAGDYTFAASRLKSYLMAAKPSKESAESAALLYTLLTDQLLAQEDAYQFLSKYGMKFRSFPAARRFDGWFLEQARARGDVAAAARMLAMVVADNLPAAQERMYYGQYLDWVTAEISRPGPKHYEALSTCQKILSAIRCDKVAKAQLAFFVANLAFQAGSAGKDDAALTHDLAAPLLAAKAYFDAAPTAKTLNEIVEVLAGGRGGFDWQKWKQAGEPKQKFFVAAFEKLTDPDKEEVLNWPGRQVHLAAPEQWLAIATKNAKFLATTPAAGNIPLPIDQMKTRDECLKFAEILRSAANDNAAVVRALAAGNELTEVLDALVKNDSWHLSYTSYNHIITNRIFRIWRLMHESDADRLSAQYFNKAWLHFGSKHLCNSPVAIYDTGAVSNYLQAAWNAASDDPTDKSQVGKYIELISWAPFGEAGGNRNSGKQALFQSINSWAKAWADSLRAAARTKKGQELQDLQKKLAQIVPVTDAIKQLRGAAKPENAPNALCKAMAEFYRAETGRDAAKRALAARAVYQIVRRYAQAKTPYGKEAFQRITEPNQRVKGDLAIQLEMLADQLADYKPGENDELVARIVGQIYNQRQDLRPGQANSKLKADSLKIADLMGKAVIRLADKGEFSPTLFNWFRGYRVGRNWKGGKAGQDVFIKLMEKGLFQKAGYRVHSSYKSATTTYMWLIRNEFPELAEKYPLETYFDDMYVAEAKQAKYLDWSYWDYARDTKGKIARATAELLSANELPMGDDREGTYTMPTLMRWLTIALNADPALRKAALDKIEAAHGKTRFDPHAMGYGRFTDGQDPQPSDRKQFFAVLGKYVDLAGQAPLRLPMPPVHQLKDIEAKDLSDQEVDVLLRMFTTVAAPYWPRSMQYEKAAQLLVPALRDRGRWPDLLALAGPCWKLCRDTRDTTFMRSLTGLAAEMRKARNQDLALAYSAVGLTVMERDLPSDARSALTGVRTWAMADMGGMIPVAKGDPLYPLYDAQLAYLGGRYQSAWKSYFANRTKLVKSFREFDPMFCAWIIEKNTEFKDYDSAEELAREVMAWFDEVPDQIEPEARARLQLSYARIAMVRGDRPRARALLARIVTNKDFAGTRSQMDADLAIADVDTQDGNYDKAIERLTDLSRRKHPYMETEAAYHMALVKYAQEEYAAAGEQLESLFLQSYDHADGRILEGRVNLKLKKLEQPTDIDLGEKIGKKYILPGQPVRVTLLDQNLSVVRKAAEIEIRAWADSGDEEFFTLSPFGDSKTKFKGQIPTALGKPAKGDKVLQVLGKDRVHYAFSDAFASAQKIEFNTPFTLQVATDAELYVSSGGILTKEQREGLALEQMIRRRMGAEPDGQVALSTVRREDQVRPGNKVNVRVVDADRGETPGKDRVTVRVAAASGDSIAEFELIETGEYTGIFEGAVPTEPAQATAYASDSLEGSEANFTISRRHYPAWVGLPKTSKNRPKTLSVNLNDNVALGKMRISAKEQGRKLKSFQVQTSFNGKDFETVGAWPEAHVPWDGNATVTFSRWEADDPSDPRALNTIPRTAGDFRNYLEQGYIRQGTPKVSAPVKSVSAAWDAKLAGQGRALGLDTNKNTRRYYVAHIKAAFHQPRRKVRTFALTSRKAQTDETRPVNYVIVLDGESGSERKADRDNKSVYEVRKTLSKGTHVLEIFVFAEQNADPSFEVSCDTNEPPYVVPCPPEMFDIAKNPNIAAGLAKTAATVKANEDNTAFEVAFTPDCRARVIRLLLADFETDAPGINRIALTDAAGKEVLPTKYDFMDLRKNGSLEIVPGDRVTVTYEDPKVLTLGKEQHEAFLTATYTDATLRACFVEHEMLNTGERRSNYIAMRRFGAGDEINVFINDPDGDLTDKQDAVKFTARTSDGKTVALDALETEEHSGVFLGVVFPVAGDPNRPSELKVKAGDDVVLSYMDRENIHPGIPWPREFSVEQVWYTPPELRIYNVRSLTLDEADTLAGRAAQAATKQRGRRLPTNLRDDETAWMFDETVPARRTLLSVRADKQDRSKPASYVIGGPLLVEVLFPAITKSEMSECTIYAQTAGGRTKAGAAIPAGGFDPNVPGTIKLSRRTGGPHAPIAPPGYREVIVRGDPNALSPLDDGRYTFAVPVRLAAVPDKTLIHADQEAEDNREPFEQPELAVSGEDEIFIGMQYKDADGKDKWIVHKAALTGDSFFDVMDRRYEEPVAGAYVGESVYFRVIDPAKDASDEKDLVALELTTKSGQKKQVELVETFTHSGVFKGLARLVHAQDKAAVKELGAMPTIYGDVLSAKYVSLKTGQSAEYSVAIFKGADGHVLPFTKRFKDPAVAVETQFMIAEAYFELAKRHRQLGEESLARREIAQGRRLLEEAIADYPNTTARAQAEYLLADLALESGNDAANAALKKKYFMDAIAKYGDIVSSYPDNEYAPKAQFRKALAYEKMDMLDEACEEYVKLSYRYPDNPLVAETIARLGQYFLNKGRGFLAAAEKQTDPVEGEKIRMQGREMFKTGGQVFARLSERFPNHSLAGKTLLLSAQCYMQGEDYPAAIKGYDRVITKPDMDKDLVAEAMYWAGHTHMQAEDLASAYRMFKKLTWDYPASSWAKFARGRLADERLLDIEE